MMFPVHRISHTDVCPGNVGRRCACDRDALGAIVRWSTRAAVVELLIILALLAAVLK